MATEIENYLADNYDEIVADERRNVSYEDIAKHAESTDDPRLAAWARERAASKGKNTTPKNATAAPKTTRAPRAKSPAKPKTPAKPKDESAPKDAPPAEGKGAEK